MRLLLAENVVLASIPMVLPVNGKPLAINKFSELTLFANSVNEASIAVASP